MNKRYLILIIVIIPLIIILLKLFFSESCKIIPSNYMYGISPSCNLSLYYNLNTSTSPSSLIFTLIANIKEDEYINFFKSLEKVRYESNVLIITDEDKQLWNSSRFKIDYIILENDYPYYPSNHPLYPINQEILKKYIPKYIVKMKRKYFYSIIRYLILSVVLKEYSKKFEYYLLTDAKDVIFQKHPFKWSICPGVYLVEESKYRTLEMVYREFNLQYFKNKTELKRYVINGGLIFGSSKEMKMFFVDFVRLYIQYGFAGNDQSFLNYFFYILHPFKYPVILNEEYLGYAKCIGQNLAESKDDLIDNTGFIRNKDGSIPVIVHQYDAGIRSKSRRRRKKYLQYLEDLT